MPEQPLVSVTMPAYNAERFIAKSLQSVLDQSYRNLEILIVDDGSEDGTGEIVESFAGRDARIRLIRQANLGAGSARNRAIEEAKGEFIASIDADDLWAPDKLEKQVDCMLRGGPDVGVVYCWCLYIDEEDRPTSRCAANSEEGDVYLQMLCYNFLSCGSNALVRREAIQNCGLYRTDIMREDKELYMRIAERYDFKVVPEVLVAYRQVKTSRSHLGHERGVRNSEFIVAEALRRHPSVPARVLRWSLAIAYAFAASRSAKSGDFASALRYMARAVWNDPTCLLRIGTYLAWSLKRWRARPGRPEADSPEGQELGHPGTGPLRWSDSRSFSLDPAPSPLGILKERRLAFMRRHALRKSR